MNPKQGALEEPIVYALSLKQPWASLLLHGCKTIEVRRWATRIRGRIWIHAARVPDPRDYGWSLVPESLRELSQLGGGVIGSAMLTDCVCYTDAATFASDEPRHRNDPSWFKPPMYGFVFEKPLTRPFARYPGNVRFFSVRALENLTASNAGAGLQSDGKS